MQGEEGAISRHALWYSPTYQWRPKAPEKASEETAHNQESAALKVTSNANQEGVVNNVKPVYFGRCYCCLDSEILGDKGNIDDTDDHTDNETTNENQSTWKTNRKLFFKHPSMSHFMPTDGNQQSVMFRTSSRDEMTITSSSDLHSEPLQKPTKYLPHNLCQKCCTLCEVSPLIRLGLNDEPKTK
ncbi:hypothetical protein G7Y89_g8649 [Cudoniella acicularis]|uniref:Uncharacterized protein n=1 Tax=Cudoniella acicularis TaxID=354080 RepID=A0A8H4RG74_9HELO|nr:hypothetical protein G7Y89_g8649 [Cudoniella acicularis]